jgi:hypothetical protein
MNTYIVKLTYGTFFIKADYYSISAGRYQFWLKKKVIVQYLMGDVVSVNIQDPQMEE